MNWWSPVFSTSRCPIPGWGTFGRFHQRQVGCSVKKWGLLFLSVRRNGMEISGLPVAWPRYVAPECGYDGYDGYESMKSGEISGFFSENVNGQTDSWSFLSATIDDHIICIDLVVLCSCCGLGFHWSVVHVICCHYKIMVMTFCVGWFFELHQTVTYMYHINAWIEKNCWYPLVN